MAVANVRDQFRGLIVPMVTPITQGGEIDDPAVGRVVNHLIDGGVDGIFVLGTTGEGASVPMSQKGVLVQRCICHTSGRAVVYAGISGSSLTDSLNLAQRCKDLGAAAAVAHPPSAYALGDQEMADYFTSLADQCPLPLFLYEIPKVAHASISISVVRTLMDHPNIGGIKDSSGDCARVAELFKHRGNRTDFAIHIGTASLCGRFLRQQADGIVPSGANLSPQPFAQMVRAAAAGDWAAVDRLQCQTDAEAQQYQNGRSLGQSLAALKALMACRGLCQRFTYPPIRSLEKCP